MAISRRYIDERDDALDVVQDSFVSILTSIGSFKYRDEGSLKAWVSRIVANKAVDWIKHHKALVFTDDIPDETEENEPDVEQVPPEILNGLINRLPIGCRTVLNLYVFEQLPHKEIAHRLGINTVLGRTGQTSCATGWQTIRSLSLTICGQISRLSFPMRKKRQSVLHALSPCGSNGQLLRRS